MPAPRGAMSACAVDGIIYAIGGFNDINGIVDITMVESIIDTPCIDKHTIVRSWTAIDGVGNHSTVEQVYAVTSCGVSAMN